MRHQPQRVLFLILAAFALATALASAQTTSLPSVGANWIFEGPAPVNDPTYGPLGGTVTALLTSGSGVLAGTAGGGIWAWQGGVWKALTDSAPSLTISALAAGPNGTIYAGTGDWSLSDGGASAQGLLVSNDGGASWQAVAGSSALAGLTITGIWADPNNSAHWIVATIAPPGGTGGGVYETSTGGGSWSQVFAGQAWSLAWDAPNLLIGTSSGVEEWQSGGSITALTQPMQAAQFFVGSGGGKAAVLGLDANGACVGIEQTGDLQSWAQIGCPNGLALRLAPPLALAYDGSGTLWLGGSNVWNYTGNGWQIAGGSIATPGSVHALKFEGTNIWAGAAGGAWELLANAPAWTNLNGTAGSEALGAIRLGSVGAGSAGLIAATEAIDILANGSGLAWNAVAKGTGAVLETAPSDPNTVYAALPDTSGMLISTNGGATYKSINWSAGTGPSYGDITLAGRAVIAVDPSAPAHLFWATDRLWESSDGGQSWSMAGLLTSGGSAFTAIAIAPQNSAIFYFGTSQGQFFNSAGLIIPSGLPSRVPITALAVDPDMSATAAATAPQTVIAGFGGASGGVYLTTNGGTNWRDISGSLPPAPVAGLEIDPIDPGIVYVAESHGVFATPDDGASWYRLGFGLPNATITDLRLVQAGSTRLLVVATAGRGAWALPLAESETVLTATQGNGQSGTVGLPLANPLVVTAQNTFGLPLANATVIWTDTGAGGSFTQTQTITAADGTASVSYTLPSKAGAISIAATTSGGGTANFTETAEAATATSVLAAAGGGQSGVIETVLAQAIVAKVADQFGNPVAGVTVTFSDGGAGGSFNPATAITDAQGQAGTQYTLPATVGTVTVTAAVAGLPPATYTESALAAPDFSIALNPATENADVARLATFQLTTSAPAGETRVINLACISPATGCNVMPGSVSPGGTASVSVSFSNVGNNTFTVQANDGEHTHQVTGTVNVLAPNFALSISTPATTLDQVATNTFSIATTAINGDFHLISLACVAPSSGCSFTPAQVSPGQSATLTIAAHSLAAGGQTITIQGSDGTNQHTAALALTVVPPGLTVAAQPAAATVAAGQAATITVTVTPTGGLTGPVAFRCSGLPEAANCAFQPATWTSQGSGSGTIGLTLATTANGMAPPFGQHWFWLLPLLLLPAILPGRLHGRSRVAAIAALALATAACGGMGAPATTPAAPAQAGTPTGTYQVTIVAQSGNVTNQSQLELTVN